MFFDINNEHSRSEVVKHINTLDMSKEWRVEVKKKVNQRTKTQNAALHLFFTWCAEELSNIGLTFNYVGLKGLELEIPYTAELFKDCVWRPIQKTLFDIESTTELDTEKINKILDVLIYFFAKNGIEIHFPNQFDLMIKQLENRY